MLPWWGWLVFWCVLLLGSTLWLGVLARGVWRRVKDLGGEVERASGLVAALEARVDEPGEVEPPPRTAATQPPHRMREEYREQRAQQVAQRRVRRARRMPPWARVE